MVKKQAIFLALLYGIMMVLFFSPNPSFSIFNEKWDGCSNLTLIISEMGGEVKLVGSLEGFNATKDLEGEVLVILSPVSEFEETEREEIFEFVRKGGGLIIAEDFREGSSISECFGIKFSKELLLDPSSYSKQPCFPIANLTFNGKSCSILLNYPSTLVLTGRFVSGKYIIKHGGEELECKLSILARSSRLSWLDVDCDLSWDEGEPRHSFPLIGLIELERGRVAVVSDPDLFINDMIIRFDNLEVARYLLEYVSGNSSSPTFYFFEERVWRVKPLLYYVLSISAKWSELPLFSRLFLSFTALGLIFLGLLFGISYASGYPFLRSILGMFGGVEGELEEGKVPKALRVEEVNYGEYLVPIFEAIFEKLKEDLGLESFSPEDPRLVDMILAKHPSLDARSLSMLIERYRDLLRGGRISDFRTFARIFDALMMLGRELEVEW